MKQKIPKNILLIGLFLLILGVWGVLDSFYPTHLISMNLDKLGFFFVASSTLYACFLISSIGFLLLRKWGRVIACTGLMGDLILSSWGMAYGMRVILLTGEPSAVPFYLEISAYSLFVAEIIILYYITRPEIRAQFK